MCSRNSVMASGGSHNGREQRWGYLIHTLVETGKKEYPGNRRVVSPQPEKLSRLQHVWWNGLFLLQGELCQLSDLYKWQFRYFYIGEQFKMRRPKNNLTTSALWRSSRCSVEKHCSPSVTSGVAAPQSLTWYLHCSRNGAWEATVHLMQQCKGYTLFTSYTCLPIPAFFSMQLSCILKVEIVIGKKIHQVGLERKRRFNTIIAALFSSRIIWFLVLMICITNLHFHFNAQFIFFFFFPFSPSLNIQFFLDFEVRRW